MSGTRASQARPAGRRREILEAALRCFEELGYEAATIEDIRRHSGASVGSIYHHFGSKAAVAAAVYLEGLEDYQRGLLARVRRARDARAAVAGVVRFHLAWATAHPSWARYLFSMRQLDAVAAHEVGIRERNERFLAELFSLIAPFVERGELAALPPQILLAVVHGPVHDYLRVWIDGRAELGLERAGELLVDAAWRSVRAADASEQERDPARDTTRSRRRPDGKRRPPPIE